MYTPTTGNDIAAIDTSGAGGLTPAPRGAGPPSARTTCWAWAPSPCVGCGVAGWAAAADEAATNGPPEASWVTVALTAGAGGRVVDTTGWSGLAWPVEGPDGSRVGCSIGVVADPAAITTCWGWSVAPGVGCWVTGSVARGEAALAESAEGSLGVPPVGAAAAGAGADAAGPTDAAGSGAGAGDAAGWVDGSAAAGAAGAVAVGAAAAAEAAVRRDSTRTRTAMRVRAWATRADF
jgi:hypothetical protein